MFSSAGTGWMAAQPVPGQAGQNVPGWMAAQPPVASQAMQMANLQQQQIQWRTFDESAREVRVR
jgi:hypothetical protein